MERATGGSSETVTIHPVTEDRWSDIAELFGANGACGGCWCMLPRLTRAEFERGKGRGNRHALRSLIRSGNIPGLLAYVGDVPAGWCAVGPRSEYGMLQRSRLFKPIDETPVWSIVCLFIGRSFRRTGLSVALIRGAVSFATAQGATVVEAYPVTPKKRPMPDAFAHMGLRSAYEQAGFSHVAQASETRSIMRFAVDDDSG